MSWFSFDENGNPVRTTTDPERATDDSTYEPALDALVLAWIDELRAPDTLRPFAQPMTDAGQTDDDEDSSS